MFDKAKWIWATGTTQIDDYVEFSGSFFTNDNNVKVKIACDTVYAFYLGDKLIKTMMCSDFPNDKYVDIFELSDLKEKENHLII